MFGFNLFHKSRSIKVTSRCQSCTVKAIQIRFKENKAGYTAKPVACCWARAMMADASFSAQILETAKKVKGGPTDGPTQGWTDRPT